MNKKVILLVNLGTPDKPDLVHVAKYLIQFLNDSRVIDIPWLFRKILVNLIIVPFRVRKSSKLYQMLWSEKGSPLLFYTESLVAKLQSRVGDEYLVTGAMRYGNPSLKSVLKTLRSNSCENLVVLPLYPQYASSTTGSVSEYILNEISKWNKIPELHIVNQFYAHPSFLNAFSGLINKYNPAKYDKLVFSYHGLPLSQIEELHQTTSCDLCECERHFPTCGNYCYKATCFETTRLLTNLLNIPSEKCVTTFQSRLTKKWLTPFTDKTLSELLAGGHKKVLIIAPSFVTDCLETIVEIDNSFKSSFIKAGGDELTLVESLNDGDEWAEAILKILKINDY